MKITKKITAVAAFAATMTLCAKTSTPEGWTDDYDAALKQAADEGKYVLVDFSGSDWCGWCIKLDEEVFSKEEFLKEAKKNFVFLMIDSPKDKKKLSDKAKKQNPKLTKKYGIRGYPTVLILDSKGEVVAKTGYKEGGPEKYIEHINGLVEGMKDPDFVKYVKSIEKELEKVSEDTEKKIDDRIMKFVEREQKKREIAQTKATLAAFEAEVPAFEAAIKAAEAKEVPEKYKAKKDAVIDHAKDQLKFYTDHIKKMKSYLKELKEGKGKKAK